MIFCLFFIHFAQACYIYSCGLLDSGVCAQRSTVSSNLIEINTQVCENSYSCSRGYVEDILNTTTDEVIDCYYQEISEVAQQEMLNYYIDCPVRNNTIDRNVTLSQFLVSSCDGVCYHENSNSTGCICGFDGAEHCLPNKSSAIFDRF